MHDRSVEFPNRYRMNPVPGTADIVDLVPAPGEVTNEGTAMNKATMLKDATATLVGLDADALPDDVFAVLSNRTAKLDKSLGRKTNYFQRLIFGRIF